MFKQEEEVSKTYINNTWPIKSQYNTHLDYQQIDCFSISHYMWIDIITVSYNGNLYVSLKDFWPRISFLLSVMYIFYDHEIQ